MEPLDPFADIDPLVNGFSLSQYDCNLTSSIDINKLVWTRKDGDSEDGKQECGCGWKSVRFDF